MNLLRKRHRTRRANSTTPSRRAKTIIGVLAGIIVAALALLVAIPTTSGSFTGTITGTTNTAGTRTWFTCNNAEAGTTGAYFAYPLNDPTGATVAVDTTGNNRAGTYSGTVTRQATASPCVRDNTTTARFDGSTGLVTGPAQNAPTAFTIEAWYNAPAGFAPGVLVGMGSQPTGASTSYDRMLYLSSYGQLVFGVSTTQGGNGFVSTPPSMDSQVLDGKWHHVIATFAPATDPNPGMRVYWDNTLIDSKPTYTTPTASYTGYWRVGNSTCTGWTSCHGSAYGGYLAGTAVYTRALTPIEIKEHYQAGKP